MKILVCVSKTPDTTAKIQFKAGNTQFEESGVQYIMNPYDEWYALVRALELQEQHGGTVTLIHVGDVSADTIIRKGLAIGADDAVRIDIQPESADVVARQIAAWAADKGFDMILLGKETIDYNGSEVGSMLAGLLDMPFISYASKMEFDGSRATITRDIEGGKETLHASTPFILSAAKGLAEQRIPNMRGIMMAKRKPLSVEKAADTAAMTRVVSYSLPPAKSSVKLFEPDQMDALVDALHNDSKVI